VPEPVRVFTRHYVEMLVAMLGGMAILYPQWALLTAGAAHDSWVMRPEADACAMATAMAVPTVAWMLHRGLGRRLVLEMVVSTYAGFAVLFPAYWSGRLTDMGLMMAGHVLMPMFMMSAAMVVRHREYAAA
jgi:hypothetical protein